MLYNTCSIRDKAEQKVFTRLGQFNRKNKCRRQGQDLRRAGLRGAAGRREDFRARAARQPGVRLGQLQQAAGDCWCSSKPANRRVTGLGTDTDETFDTPFTRRDNPHRAYITIIEGCDKSCAYCVVPFTRGPERSRTSASRPGGSARAGRAGYTEIQLLGQNVNSYRDPSPRGWDFAELLAAVGRNRRASAACASPPRIRAISRRGSSTRSTRMPRSAITCTCRCNPVRPACCAPMQRLYTRDEYMRQHRMVEARAPPHRLTTDIIVGFPGETEAGFRGDARACWTRSSTTRCSASSTRRGRTRRRWAWTTRFRKRRRAGAWLIVLEKQRAIQIRAQPKLGRPAFEVLVEGRNRRRWASGSGARPATAR